MVAELLFRTIQSSEELNTVFTSFRFFCSFIPYYCSSEFWSESVHLSFTQQIRTLIACCVFLILLDFFLAICLLLLTAIAYFCARFSERKKWILIFGIIVSVTQLFVYKYYDFFIGSFSQLLGNSHTIHLILLYLIRRNAPGKRPATYCPERFSFLTCVSIRQYSQRFPYIFS